MSVWAGNRLTMTASSFDSCLGATTSFIAAIFRANGVARLSDELIQPVLCCHSKEDSSCNNMLRENVEHFVADIERSESSHASLVDGLCVGGKSWLECASGSECACLFISIYQPCGKLLTCPAYEG